jgi:hypothetical protein
VFTVFTYLIPHSPQIHKIKNNQTHAFSGWRLPKSHHVTHRLVARACASKSHLPHDQSTSHDGHRPTTRHTGLRTQEAFRTACIASRCRGLSNILRSDAGVGYESSRISHELLPYTAGCPDEARSQLCSIHTTDTTNKSKKSKHRRVCQAWFLRAEVTGSTNVQECTRKQRQDRIGSNARDQTSHAIR